MCRAKRFGMAVLALLWWTGVVTVHVAAQTPEAQTMALQQQRGLLALQRGDVASAMGALRAPARAGHAPSQSLLAYILERADLVAEAVPLWTAAAAQGDADAHAGLGSLYQSGRGVIKDEKLALRHFSEAAARGHAASVELVAQAWLQGQLGAHAAADPDSAQAALLRAAEQGHLASADALAGAYRSGRWGLKVDLQQAQAWQDRAKRLRDQRASAVTKAPP